MRKGSISETPLRSLIGDIEDKTIQRAFERALDWLKDLEDRVEKLESEK